MNNLISESWSIIINSLKMAPLVTIFGYSAPKSDKEAINLFKTSWGNKNTRKMEQIEIIDIANEEKLKKSWNSFIFNDHCNVEKNFFQSSIAYNPRKTIETFYKQNYLAEFTDSNFAPKNITLSELQNWFKPLINAEL